MEVDCAKAAMHMLVEKPISMRPAEEVERLAQVRYDHSHEQPTLNLYIMYAMSAVGHVCCPPDAHIHIAHTHLLSVSWSDKDATSQLPPHRTR